MNNIKNIIGAATLAILSVPAVANAENYTVKGTVVDPLTNKPVSGAVITGAGLKSSITSDSEGKFTFESESLVGLLSVWYPGFNTGYVPINGREELKIVLTPGNTINHSENINLPFSGYRPEYNKATALHTKQKKDMKLSASNIEALLSGIPGLQITQKSGMIGEGAFMRIRGNNSIIANNSPLIVIDGIPYLPDMNESAIIGGYSKSIFNPFNATDIENITLLKGADAAVYGSMGANGVILIETDKATDMETRVEFIGQYGFNMNQTDMPVLGVNGYKKLVSSVAMTQYSDMNDILNTFPYLVDNPDYYYKFLYNNNTDWQDQIYQNGFTTDNVLKIKGGDAIAKYDISIGYANAEGQLKNTGSEKYYARLNADINLSRRFSMFTTLSLASQESNLMEQGIIKETNPILAAYRKAPIFSAYEKDADNNYSPDFSSIYDADGNLIKNNLVSNPLAIVEELMATSQLYDTQASLGLKAKLTDYWSLLAKTGLNYTYNRQRIFVPGVTTPSIMPTQDGLAMNSSYSSVARSFNIYYSLSAAYDRTYDKVHNLKGNIGYQSAITKTELDAAGGRNTVSDFYKSIGQVDAFGRNSNGYDNAWNWMNMFANVNYTYANIIGLGVTASYDGSSASGPDTNQFGFFPGINASWYINNTPGINELSWLNKATLRAEYVTTGNSRFNSNISKYYYESKMFRSISTIVLAGVPNTELKWETTNTMNVGLDLNVFNNYVGLTVDLYKSKTSDLITPRSISSALGTNYMYVNGGEIQNTGVELGIQISPVQTKNMTWTVGATLNKNKNEVLSLPVNDKSITSFFNDGSAIVTEVGSPLYSFYGYKTKGVFATTAQAEAANLTLPSGKKFQAGDMIFEDLDGNGIINDKDRTNLGSASPDYFGNIFTTFRYKNFELYANFGYSKGNKMYNAVRQQMESMSDYGNQYQSVNKRWMQEGQITNMPRAQYGDPMGNSRFSDRWIEDASYIKLKEIMVSYRFNVMNGITVYASGENLITFTDYLGSDPESMYSYHTAMEGFDYGKVALPRTVKLGVKLQF